MAAGNGQDAPTLRRIARGADRAARILSNAAMAISTAAILLSLALVCYGVVMRYFVNDPQSWVDEMVAFLLVAIVMLGSTDALRRNEHIAIDILTSRLRRRGRQIVAVIGLISVAAVGVLLITQGWAAAAFALKVNLRSTGYLEAPVGVLELLLPLGGGLLLLNAATLCLRTLAGDDPMAEAPAHEPGSVASGLD